MGDLLHLGFVAHHQHPNIPAVLQRYHWMRRQLLLHLVAWSRQSKGTTLYCIESLHVDSSTKHPRQGTVLQVWTYLCPVPDEDVKTTRHPMQGRDSQGGLACDSSNAMVEAQTAVYSHSQDLDVFLEGKTLLSKTQLS